MKAFNPHRRQAMRLIAGASASLCAAPAVWSRQDYPAKPIRFVVPFNPGGATDSVARVLARAMSGPLGQPIVVENKSGAAGMLGTDLVAKAAPDGYTFTVSLSTSLLINQFLYAKMAYQPERDLLMLSQIAGAPVTLVVHPSVPASTMPELIKWVAANPGKMSYGSWGVGSYAHLAGAYLSKTTDGDMAHIAYKGEAPMIQDLIGGQLQLCFSSAQNTRPFIENSRLKAIGVTGTQRMRVLPSVPTLFEQGVTDAAYSIFGWVGMAAPAGVPSTIIDRVHAALLDASRDASVQENIVGAGFIPIFNTPGEFAQAYARDVPVWQELIKIADARVD